MKTVVIRIFATIISINIMLVSYNAQLIMAETINVKTQQSNPNVINSPLSFKGTSSKGVIKIRWKKDVNVNGYYLFKNGKKIKKLKKTKTSYKDKKVKLNRTYSYKIQSYKKINGEIAKSKKSYKIKVKATNAKSKKINVARFTNVKKVYKLGVGESLKIKPKVKFTKKLKGKKARKKKVYSKKIYYKSSNPGLISVNKKGVIKATTEKKYESAIITLRAHNGITKKIEVRIVNFAQIGAVKNLDLVRCDTTKQLLTTYKKYTSKIAEYFQDHPTKERVTIKDGEREVKTEDGGVTYEDCLDMSEDIYIEKEMYDYILSFLLNKGIFGTEIVVSNQYVYFRYKQYYMYGIEAHDLVYVFNNKSALDNYQYMNAIYDITSVADRWYYGKGMAYGPIG